MIDLPSLDSIVLGTDALAFLDRNTPNMSQNNRENCLKACIDLSSTLIMRSGHRSIASSVDLPVLKSITTKPSSATFFGPHHAVLEGCSPFQFSFTRFAFSHFGCFAQSLF